MRRQRRSPVRFAACLTCALFAAACGEGAPEVEIDDPFESENDAAQALSVDCTGSTVCTGNGETYPTSFRVGHAPTSRGELLQTFQAATDTAPTSLTLLLRRLRTFTLAVGAPEPQVHVAIYGPTNPANPVATGTPVASGAIAVNALGTGATTITFVGAQPLTHGLTYAVRVWTDDLEQGNPGTLLVGVGALVTSTYAHGAAWRRGLRRVADAPPDTGWGESRFRSAGSLQVAFALSTACTNCTLVATASTTTAAGDALSHAWQYYFASFTVFVADQNGQPMTTGGAAIDAHLSYLAVRVPANVLDNGDGTYTVKYLVPVHTYHATVDVTLGGTPIAGSPWNVDVGGSTYGPLSVITNDLSDPTGIVNTFVFTMNDASGAPVLDFHDHFQAFSTNGYPLIPLAFSQAAPGLGNFTFAGQVLGNCETSVQVVNDVSALDLNGSPFLIQFL